MFFMTSRSASPLSHAESLNPSRLARRCAAACRSSLTVADSFLSGWIWPNESDRCGRPIIGRYSERARGTYGTEALAFVDTPQQIDGPVWTANKKAREETTGERTQPALRPAGRDRCSRSCAGRTFAALGYHRVNVIAPQSRYAIDAPQRDSLAGNAKDFTRGLRIAKMLFNNGVNFAHVATLANANHLVNTRC